MVWHFRRWKVDHPGLPVPLAMFATTVGALLWGWTSLGVGVGDRVSDPAQCLRLDTHDRSRTCPAAIFLDASCHRLFLADTRPTSRSTCCCRRPPAAACTATRWGGSRSCNSSIFSMPIGIHHLFVDPQIGAGFKFLHAVFTGMVAVPTLLTIFTICASLEIAGRLRGGRGPFGWIAALPWDRPFVLATGLLNGHAGTGRRERDHQHELRAELDGPQYAMGYRPFSPDLRWSGRYHVLCDRIRTLAAIDRSTARSAKACSAAIVDLVCRDVDRYPAVASGRGHGTAPAHGLLRFHQSRAGFPGHLGQRIRDRRLRSCFLGDCC